MAEIIRIDADTYRIEDNGVRFFLLEGSRKALMIDSGRGTPEARAIAESITTLPLLLLNTHADPDHISGNAAFDEVYMSPAEEPHYREKGGTGKVLPVYDDDKIDLGDRTLRIIDNPGHTPGSIAVLDEKNRVLIGGDSIQDGNIYMFGGHRDLIKYTESLRRILTMKSLFDTVYPSHGSFPVSPEIIERLIDGSERIMNRDAVGEEIMLHGTGILLYRFDYAGFYCDHPEN